MSKKDIAAGFNLPAPKPAAPIDEVEAERFEQAKSPIFEAPKLPEPKPVKPHSRLRSDKRGERLCCYLPPKLHERLRVKCARERRSLSDAVTDAVTLWLQGAS